MKQDTIEKGVKLAEQNRIEAILETVQGIYLAIPRQVPAIARKEPALGQQSMALSAADQPYY